MHVHIFASWIQLIYFCGVLCQNVVYFSQVNWLQYIWRVNPSQFFYCLQGNNHKRVGPRVTKACSGNPYKFILAFYKEIISIELYQGTLSPIGLIPDHFPTGYKAVISIESDRGSLRPILLIPIIYFRCLEGNNINRVGPRGIKSHWVNT